jgi:small neutral amino acid transporter SnatA (MarC family)
VADILRTAVLLVALLDVVSAAIGLRELAGTRPERERRAVAGAGGAIAFALLTALAIVAEPLLDTLDISDPAAALAAGLVVTVLALDLLVQGPARHVRAAPHASVARLALFPYGVPLLAGPATAAAVIAWAPARGTGTVIGGAAVATAVVTIVCRVWPRPPLGRNARVLGAFAAVAIALVAADLVRDGVFGT